MKDIKHIRQEFHLAAWVMPQGRDLGVPWGVGGGGSIFFPKFSQIWCVSYTYMNGTCTGAIFWVPAPWGLWEGQKKTIIKFELQSQFQRLLNQTLCIISQMKDI